MATFSLDIPDELQPRIQAAYAADYGYDGAPEDLPAFVMSKVVISMVARVTNYEARVAAQAAEEAARAQAETDFGPLLEQTAVPDDATEPVN